VWRNHGWRSVICNSPSLACAMSAHRLLIGSNPSRRKATATVPRSFFPKGMLERVGDEFVRDEAKRDE
jgi:hypothetical protein